MLKDIGHGDQLDGTAFSSQGVCRRPRPPTATADQSQPNRVVLGSMDGRDSDAGQYRSCGNPARILQKFTTRRISNVLCIHN
jgi:hypothetical protein